MSEKLRRQKDIIKNSTESYLNAITDYQDYYDGSSPISITYYQISDETSRTDTSLEDVHEVVGANSSLKYNRIKHLPARGMLPIDPNNQLTQRGLETFISGEFVLSPSAGIFPRAGEFFRFEEENVPALNTHLFMITDVQFDKMSSQKFFKCTYKLYPLDADNIDNDRMINKKYVYSTRGKGNDDGVGDSVLITEEQNDLNDAIDNMTDSLIDKFEELFYDEGMDTFVYQKAIDQTGTNFRYYWNPYICHFIYKNDILEKSHREFLTEIYVQDVNESEYPYIYSEEGYRKSIFYATELCDGNGLNLDSSFMEVSAYDLSKPLSLPFFTSGAQYSLVDVQHKYNVDFWYGAFDWLYDDEDHLYNNLDGLYRYREDTTISDTNIPLIDYLIKQGLLTEDGQPNIEKEDLLFDHTFYQLENNSDKIKSMIRFPKNDDPYFCDLNNLIQDPSELPDLGVLFKMWRDYMYSNGSFTINEIILDQLNKEYYENSMKNYILMPIIIYILQHSKGEIVNATPLS